MRTLLSLYFLTLMFLIACNEDDTPDDTGNETRMQLSYIRVGTVSLLTNDTEIPTDQPLVISFSVPVDTSTVNENIILTSDQGDRVPVTFAYLEENKIISALLEQDLQTNTTYTITITENIRGVDGQTFPGFSTSFTTTNPPLEVTGIRIDESEINTASRIRDVDLQPTIQILFSDQVTTDQLTGNIRLVRGNRTIPLTLDQENGSAVNVSTGDEVLEGWQRYRLVISAELGDAVDQPFDEFAFSFYTEVDSTLKFPELSDEELLTKVQEQTFRYFWDFAHPVSGLTRERNTSGDLVTSGGSGFGLMAIIVGIERGFITRQEGVERLDKIVTFLDGEADRFHGVWPHWLNGNTGEVIPFSSQDDGGDLVETAFLVQGLLTVRQYLDPSDAEEAAIIERINELWESVEWTWYNPEINTDEVLLWHWSPNHAFAINHEIRGWNEALIVYVLAASSPTYPIDEEVYHQGWARNGAIENGDEYYGHTLPLGEPYGGPLFFSHYSFLGLDPRNLSDQYADYWTQNVSHSLINHAHAVDNPFNYVGYSENSWGFTASDNHEGYSAHSPTNDLGVITPTAAISSIPYTPEESMDAIRFFYYILGDRLWGEYGFYDAFNPTHGWTASSFLAIDQGPIVVMIENHRSGLLWELFMSAPEVQNGLDRLGFSY